MQPPLLCHILGQVRYPSLPPQCGRHLWLVLPGAPSAEQPCVDLGLDSSAVAAVRFVVGIRLEHHLQRERKEMFHV